MVSCCAHVLGLRWRKNVDSGRGFSQWSSFLGWLVINFLFVFFVFLLQNFLFSLFWNLEWNTTPTSGWEQRNPPPHTFFCCWNRNPCFISKGSLLIKSEPSSFSSSPRLREFSGLAVPPSTHFSAATGILWFWLAHQPLVIQNEGLTHTVLENSLPSPGTACFKLKQGNMCQQVSPNGSSSRLWDRICEYNNCKQTTE